MPPIVETINLKKTYLMGKVPVNALQRINLKVEKGDCIAIQGPSGSGKSTLLNMIGALDKPTDGKVIIEGIDISNLNDNRLADIRIRIGFVFQAFNLIPRLTAIENVELTMAIANQNRRKERAEKLLTNLGLKDRMKHKPAELSGGERQRVAIARAIANNPRFLLMDEPTGNIDSKTSREIMDIIKGLNDEGVTTIIVTHDPDVARQAKRIVRMLDGQIVAEETN